MVTKNSIDSSRIPVLDGINYRAWRRHISYLLTRNKTLYTLSTIKLDHSDNQETEKSRKKWDEDDALAKASMLHHMKDNIILLFEKRLTAKEMINALETKYGCRSDTQIQLLLDKFNNIKMNEGGVVGNHVNQLEPITKELADAGHTLSNKMQVTIVLNSLPPSWDHVVTSLTHSGKELAMTTLPVLLMLKEERMKRKKRDNASSSLMMAQSSHATQFKPKYKFKYKRFKKQ
jgi:hypothetical protein